MNKTSSLIVRKLVRRLCGEIELQRTLSLNEEHIYHPHMEEVSVSGALLDIKEEFSNHPAAREKTLTMLPPDQPLSLFTDDCVLFRVLRNMVINAFEATGQGGKVQVGAEVTEEGTFRFTVWNKAVIPDNEQLRIFQRNFSTKEGEGRGLGTWSIKFFGEKFLNGQVGFSSSEGKGTLFFLALPFSRYERPLTQTIRG